MSNIEGEKNIEAAQSFRDLVGPLVESSGWFPDKQITDDEVLSVLDAVETGKAADYADNDADERIVGGVNCLIAIFDELKKSEPDEESIKSSIEQLRPLPSIT